LPRRLPRARPGFATDPPQRGRSRHDARVLPAREVRLRDRLRAEQPPRLARDPDARSARDAPGDDMNAPRAQGSRSPGAAPDAWALPGEPADQNAFGELDAHLMREGTHPRLFDKLGSHPTADGTRFAVWAPSAAAVSVVGDFNQWSPDAHPLRRLPNTG